MKLSLTVAALVASTTLAAQPSSPPSMTQSGPVINSTGFSVEVPNPTFKIPDGHLFKAVWVIDRSDTASVNQQLMTIARFLNIHGRHGVPKERVQAAAVVHGSGWPSLLSDSAYSARYPGKTNPSKRLVEELVANNVQLVLCGQTAGFRGVKREELLPGVLLATSAMTALNILQAQGYQLNPW